MCSEQSMPSFEEDDEIILELRNALTIVIGRIQLLQRHTRDGREVTDDELRQALSVILEQGFRARELLARIDSAP